MNLPEMLEEVDRIARRLKEPTPFYIGKLQDPLALDALTVYSTVLVPFFAEHPWARLTLLTKSAGIERLFELEHKCHTILSWSVNPPEICDVFEENGPDIERRLEAMRRVALAGYPVRAVMMPIIPVKEWQEIYAEFTRHLLETVPIQRLTLGGICIYHGARNLMEQKIGSNNAISSNIKNSPGKTGDGRARYSQTLRQEVYSLIIKTVMHYRPDLELALCLEEQYLWRAIGLEGNIGRCNCVL